jgi:hypothetical protein
MPLIYSSSNPHTNSQLQHAMPANIDSQQLTEPHHPTHSAEARFTAQSKSMGRTELTLEIQQTGSGFYASISSAQQLLSQTAVYHNYAKATQEGYRLIEAMQRDSLSSRLLFN